MSILMTLRIAFKALARNKLRTALTMLGMIIGVAAVIAMVALGTGAQAQIEEQVKTAGTNLITDHRRAAPTPAASARGAGGNTRLVAGRRRRRCATCPKSQYVAESVGTRLQLIYGNQNWNTQRRRHERRPAAHPRPGR